MLAKIIEPFSRTEKTRFFNIFLLATITLSLLLAILLQIIEKPKFHIVLTPDTLASKVVREGTIGGFYPVQVDNLGNSYVWSKDKVVLYFYLAVRDPFEITLDLRSSSVAGGPGDKILLKVNGVEITQLQPSTNKLEFQTFTITSNAPKIIQENNKDTLKIELITTAFNPPNDTRSLGFMAKNISINGNESWNVLIRHPLILIFAPLLLIVATILTLLRKNYNTKLLGNLSFAIYIAGFLLSCFALVMMLQVQTPDAINLNTYYLWVGSLLFFAVIFLIAILNSLGIYSALKVIFLAAFNPSNLYSALRLELEPFWIIGLALLPFGLGIDNWFGLTSSTTAWVYYIILGTLFPSLLILVSFLETFWRAGLFFIQLLKILLAVYCLIFTFFLLIGHNSIFGLILGLAHWSIPKIFQSHIKISGENTKLSISLMWKLSDFKLFNLYVLCISWVAVIELIYWVRLESWLSTSVYSFVIFIFALLLITLNIYTRKASKTKDYPSLQLPANVNAWKWLLNKIASSRLHLGGNLIAVVIFGLASLRTQELFGGGASFLHWGVFVSSAQMVRQGGWLLWDVPSQYGFLNILIIAWLPIKSAWVSLFVVNAILLFATACFLFFLIRTLGKGFGNLLLALFLTLSAVFLVPGYASSITGPHPYPSVGPLRFIWCYVLLGILWLGIRFEQQPKVYRKVPLIGLIAWLIGSLWSAESAIYCAAIWLPAYIFIILRQTVTDQRGWRVKIYPAIGWLLLPLGLILAILACFAGYYSLILGQGPDWHVYFDYALAFQGGFGSYPMDIGGPVWILFIVLCLIAVTAIYFIKDSFLHPSLSLVLGIFGAVWATSSYFIGRSHPNNVINLSTIWICASILILYLITHYKKVGRWSELIKAGFLPILVVVLTIAFGNQPALMNYIGPFHKDYTLNLEKQLPAIDQSLSALLQQAQVKEEDPFIYAGMTLLPAWQKNNPDDRVMFTKTWLPTAPMGNLFIPISKERGEIYIQRYIAHLKLSGWLLRPIENDPTLKWIIDEIQYTHKPTKVFKNENWELSWYDIINP